MNRRKAWKKANE